MSPKCGNIIVVTCYDNSMVKPRGRPPTGFAQTAAERMRAYRRRLRERGVVLTTVTSHDPVIAAVRFARDTLLTPTEQDVVRRFCGGLRRLPELPLRVAIFGSRAKGGSGVNSDLDIVVVMPCARSGQIERTLNSIGLAAGAPYQGGDVGIYIRPVPIFVEDRPKSFFKAIRNQMEAVWTRPR